MEQEMRMELDNALVNEGFESPELVNAIIDAVKKEDPKLEDAGDKLHEMADAIAWAASHLI